MKPIIIEISEPITVDRLRECVEQAYKDGYEDGRRDERNVRDAYPWTPITPIVNPATTPNPITNPSITWTCADALTPK